MTDLTPVALLVEDEPHIRRFVRMALEAEGWQVHETDCLRRGLIDAGTRKPNLIVLDLGLPDGDGVDFIRDLRKCSPVPVVVLSARVDEADKIAALDAGADDYLTKPFGVGELLARVRATLRRQRQPAEGADGLVRFGDVSVNLHTRLVTRSGTVVRLTPTEYRLLAVLVTHSGRSSPIRNCRAKYGVRARRKTVTICASTWRIYGKSWRSIQRSRNIYGRRRQWDIGWY